MDPFPAPASAVPRTSNTRGRAARGAVIASAIQLFARRGYAGTSLADVAADAGVSKPSILYHFPDKDALWKGAVEDLWSEVEAFYDETWPRDLPASRELLERAVDLFIEAALRWPAYVRIPFIEGATPSWRSEWLVEKHFGRHVRLINRILTACLARGQVADADPAHLQAVLTGGVNMFVAQAAMWSQALDRDCGSADFLRAHVRTALDLTFRSNSIAKPG